MKAFFIVRLTMKERPILFSGPMVLAILEGRKTMTRRVIRDFPVAGYRWSGFIIESSRDDIGKATIVPERNMPYMAQGQIKVRCPYGEPGDRLWVRETWAPDAGDILFKADLGADDAKAIKWRPSIFIPRSASRLFLEVAAVRVERVQDITEEEAKAEGVRDTMSNRYLFSVLWDSINAKRGYGWDANPWVWVVEFKRVK
jgi:hypothetical protein